MIYGLNHIDVERQNRRAVVADIQEVTKTGFKVGCRSFAGSLAWGIGMSWLVLPENEVHFEHSLFHTYDWGSNLHEVRHRIYFDKVYDSPPKICSWFQDINQAGDWFSLSTIAEEIKRDSFVIAVRS